MMLVFPHKASVWVYVQKMSEIDEYHGRAYAESGQMVGGGSDKLSIWKTYDFVALDELNPNLYCIDDIW